MGRKSLGKSATVSCGGSGSGGGRPVRAQAAAASAAAAERRGTGGSMAHDRSSDENWRFQGPFLAVYTCYGFFINGWILKPFKGGRF